MQQAVARPAEVEDVSAVLDLVAGMFEDLGTDPTPEWRRDAGRTLTTRLWDDVGAFVVDRSDNTVPGELVACAVGVVHSSLPSPRRDGVMIGYVEWVATRSLHRRLGHGRAVNRALVGWLTDQGAAVIDLHSSAAAESLYRELGFDTPGPAALRLHTRHSVAGTT